MSNLLGDRIGDIWWAVGNIRSVRCCNGYLDNRGSDGTGRDIDLESRGHGAGAVVGFRDFGQHRDWASRLSPRF